MMKQDIVKIRNLRSKHFFEQLTVETLTSKVHISYQLVRDINQISDMRSCFCYAIKQLNYLTTSAFKFIKITAY